MIGNSSPSSRAVVSRVEGRAPPARDHGVLGSLRRHLFNNVPNSVLTIIILATLLYAAWHAFLWVIVDAVWYAPDATACKLATGACWAVIGDKYRFILFGTFPYDQQWRCVSVVVLIIGMIVVSSMRRFWTRWLWCVWVVTIVVVLSLMLGGIFGLQPTGTYLWGGLPMTLILFAVTVALGLPGAILLALGRRSHLPVIKTVSVALIEIPRGLPLLVVLFIAAVILPLFLPASFSINKFVSAQIAMVLFFAAYAAEIVRGGLQAVPRGQYEAAEAMGLSYVQRMHRIILPQALRIVIPALVNDIIRAFKNTTFVSILGLFDILGATKIALQDPLWVQFAPEVYLFVLALYFVFCFSMSRYSHRLERLLSEGRNY